ncbi:unnamed protein product [Caenorhabditis angaria]|uniref:Domain of unknown function DB domain-containing protein n=1 Tax=Caenorhabditis angaria TaxID=860376 RepID=A0A9P1IAJ2_9PELO|nr:unnamed protein product [Caenorhabditis angaria]
MSVSTIRALTILLILVSTCFADLSSCARAKCVHCAVDFINRMCPTACSGCGGQQQSSALIQPQLPPQPAPVYQTQQQQQFSHSINARQVSAEGGAQPQFNIPLQPHAQPVQFAAPNYQGQQLPYPQPVQTATLAPLVEPPKISTFDPNLSRQPADLAPEQPQIQQPQQLPQLFPQQQPAQPQGFGTQMENLFNQPNLFQLPQPQQQPQLFGLPQQPGQPNLFQLPQSTNPLDPFNLFGNSAAPLQQQGISTQQYGQVQHQGSYNYNQQPYYQQTQQPAVQQPYQQPTYQSAQVQQTYQPQPQTQQVAQPQQPYQQPYQQPQQQQYTQQYNQYQQQVQQPQVQVPQTPQQPSLPVAQPQQVAAPQQPRPLPQAPAPVAAAAAAPSIDARPVSFEKYIDAGKGTPLAKAQCPRQPGWQPCITKESANDRFRNCCSRLGEGCAPLCNYDATLATMQLAVLTGRCPLSKVGDVMVCASGYEDASQCCEAYGVFEPGYEHCRPYCNPSAGLPEGGLLTEKYKCLVKLSHIQQCFFVSQKP